jgi:hypothetical protein
VPYILGILCFSSFMNGICSFADHLQDITEEPAPESNDAEQLEEEKAATKIQAVFRGHRARKTIAQECVTDDSKESTSDMSGKEAEPSKAELEAEFDPEDKGEPSHIRNIIISVLPG